MTVYLLKGETIMPDAARFFRSRPPAWHNPLATKDGQPGVCFQWLEVTGPIAVTLYAASSASDTDFTAKLVDLHPDGFARNLTDGLVRARYRHARTAPELLAPGEVTRFTIDLWATSHVFLPGHRMRLEVSSSNFPRFDRNLNTGEDQATGTRWQVAHQTVFHDARHPSHVLLPVIPR